MPKAQPAKLERDVLLHSAALQDHLTRRLKLPGGPKHLPSLAPGSKLTLAQYYGLVPRPPPLLTQKQWHEVQLKSRLRDDSACECVICKEEFRTQPQVLLSCSHVFHQLCLASFEKYARKKCCPLCRTEGYQKQVIHDGKDAWRHRCAIRIQSHVRGWLARKRFKQIRRSIPPQDSRLRKKWAAERLQEEADRVLKNMEDESEDLDALFAELDASVAQSRALTDVSGPLARRLQQVAVADAEAARSVRHGGCQPHQSNDPLPSTASSSSRSHSRVASSPCSAINTAVAVGMKQDVAWDSVIHTALSRGETECPICIGELTRKGTANVAWLSCSHVFHLDCITAFEAFEQIRGGEPSCPVCRAGYCRICL